MIPNYKNLKSIGNLTVPFGGRTKNETYHPGVDIANRKGTPIPAFADGKITAVTKTNNGFGNVVQLQDIGGNIHQYGHLQAATVKPGMRVKKGQPIAKMGSTGGTSYTPTGKGDPSHLDLRIANAYGRYKNPLTYLKNR